MDKFSELKAVAEKAKELAGINNYKKGKDAIAAFKAAANPAAILALLAELESKTDFSDKAIERISGLEKACDKYLRQTKKAERELLAAKERLAELEAKLYDSRGTILLVRDAWQEDKARADAAEKRLATPVRLPPADSQGRYHGMMTRFAIKKAGFTVEGDDE
ncbi:TPA: hypothetical protein ACXEV6_003512 [Serratia marcescens]